MALAFTIPNPHATGNVAGYGRVTRLEIDLVRGEAMVEMSWYLSAEARTAGKDPVRRDRVTISGTDYATVLASIATPFNAVRTAIYEFVTTSKYTGATPV